MDDDLSPEALQKMLREPKEFADRLALAIALERPKALQKKKTPPWKRSSKI